MSSNTATGEPSLQNGVSAKPAAPAQAHIAYIDGLRGLAVALVIVFHAGIWGGLPSGKIMSVLALGRTGVDLFLVLSGFCLFWPLVKNGGVLRALDIPDYARRRARRICPPFYAAVIVTIAASYLVFRFGGPSWWHQNQPFQDVFPLSGARSLGDLATHAFLIHGFFNQYAHSIDGAFWSLSLEWQFYFLLPLLVLVARKWSVASAITLTFAVSFLYRVVMKHYHPDFLSTYVGNELSVGRWAEFGAGMLAAYLLSRSAATDFAPTLKRWLSNGWLLLAALGITIAFEHGRSGFFLLPLMWGGAFCMLIMYAGQNRNRLRAFLEWSPLVWLGTISYSVYLIHGTVYRLMTIPVATMGMPTVERQLLFILAGPIIAVLCASLFFKMFEAPFLKRKPKVEITLVKAEPEVLPAISLIEKEQNVVTS